MDECCFLCGEERAVQRCNECGLVFSCAAHFDIHRGGDGKSCLPWKVEHRPGKGRVLVASRDLQPLDLVMEDTPVALSPIQDSAAVCLQCFRLLEEIPGCLFTCACGFNLCSAECSRGSRHKAECKVYQRSGRLAGSLEREYPLIGPIRLLQAMKDPVQGERLTRMMDHVEEMREETGRWAITQEHVVQPLVKLGAAETEEQALRCVGLFRTNGVQLRGTGVAEGEDAIDDDELGKVRALFPTMASMSHSCLPNTRIFNSPGYKMVFRTKQSVSAGEELTVCYSQVIGPARDRAQDFRDNWFFSCQCPRCNDSSDLGWHSSSWSCKDCGEAAPPPIAPQAGGVQCSCGWKVGEEEVVKLEAGLAVEVQGGPDDGADGVREWAEDFLAKADVGKLHPHHALAMVVKLRLMRAKATGLGQMMRKVEVCREVLAMLEVLQPGLTETRGIALYEMSAPRGLILQAELEEGLISAAQFADGLAQLLEELELAATCLKIEQKGTYRRLIGERASQAAKAVRQLHSWAVLL